MNMISLLSAIMFSVVEPVAVPSLSGIRQGYAVFVENTAIVAVIPDPHFGYEAKNKTLSSAASSLGEKWGREVVLTEDLLTFLTLCRIHKRGADEYERKNLASRLPKVHSYVCSPSAVGS